MKQIRLVMILIQRQEVKKINLLGRSSKVIKNHPIFYIYDDGTVEKKNNNRLTMKNLLIVF